MKRTWIGGCERYNRVPSTRRKIGTDRSSRSFNVFAASRAEVPMTITAMDVSVCFIQPPYARVAASPTKLAECVAMGIPAI